MMASRLVRCGSSVYVQKKSRCFPSVAVLAALGLPAGAVASGAALRFAPGAAVAVVVEEEAIATSSWLLLESQGPTSQLRTIVGRRKGKVGEKKTEKTKDKIFPELFLNSSSWWLETSSYSAN
jgi:hypothetical protein